MTDTPTLTADPTFGKGSYEVWLFERPDDPDDGRPDWQKKKTFTDIFEAFAWARENAPGDNWMVVDLKGGFYTP